MIFCFNIRGKYVSSTDYQKMRERGGTLYMEEYELIKGLQMCSVSFRQSKQDECLMDGESEQERGLI
jgi:hypothetical protein